MTGTTVPRPRPQPSRLTEAFWEAARRHELVRPRCRSCGRSFFVPQAVCTHCLSDDWGYEPSSGRGAVYSATVGHRPPYPGIEAPFHLAVVDLDEGWTMMSNIVDAGPEPVAIGTRVRVAWIDLPEGWTLPVFAPEQEMDR